MTKPKKRTARASAKAELMYLVYASMGSSRSLAKLVEQSRRVGVPVSQGTLQNYSRRYDWQRRVQEFDAMVGQETERELALDVATMNREQAQTGRAFRAWGAIGIEEFKRTGKAATPREYISAVEVGTKIQRLALGEATDRTDIAVNMVGALLRRIILLFDEVNTAEDPDDRALEFGAGADEIVEAVFREAGLPIEAGE